MISCRSVDQSRMISISTAAIVFVLAFLTCSAASSEASNPVSYATPPTPSDYRRAIGSAHAKAAVNRANLLRSSTWFWSDPSLQPNQVQGPGIPRAQVILFNNNNASAIAGARLFIEACFANHSSDWWRMSGIGPTSKGSSSRFSGPPLENAYSVALFTMFNSRSRWVQSGAVSSLSSKGEGGMQEFFFAYVSACALHFGDEPDGDPMSLHDSENIDSVRHTACYFGAQTLALDPAYANRSLPLGSKGRSSAYAGKSDDRGSGAATTKGKGRRLPAAPSPSFAAADTSTITVSAFAAAWEDFTYRWLGARATQGLFDELGSSGYWTRTWPCVFALHTLSAPGSRVHKRAKMFLDLALLESELSSMGLLRAGQKSRDKKATCATCSKHGNNPNLAHHAYAALTPQLYGDDMSAAAALYSAPIATQQVGNYTMSETAILMHVFGAAPQTQGIYTVRNRMMGQINGSANDAVSCSPERCAETFRPVPCSCGPIAPGQGYRRLVPRSRQVHVISKTPYWALAGVTFSPNDAFVANSQQRGTGLTFSGVDHSAVALPHLTGEKWGLVDGNVMMAQRCGSCNYGGPSMFQVFNMSKIWQQGEWWFAQAGPDEDIRGFAAMRVAYGGTNFTNATSADAVAPGATESITGKERRATGSHMRHLPLPRQTGVIGFVDTWSPFILLAGTPGDYNNSAVVFANAVQTESRLINVPLSIQPRAASPKSRRTLQMPTVSSGEKYERVDFAWRDKNYTFFPGTSAWKGQWRLPEINGKPVDNDPPFMYSSPHMNAALGSNGLVDVVVARYGVNFVQTYNFSDDTITTHMNATADA